MLEDDAGTPVSGVTGRRHPLALLALLATAPSRTMPRGKLVGLLWPESPESRARARLNTCVHNVRSALGEDALLSVGDELRLSDESLDCDVWRFERALEEEEYGRAVEHYGGPFLEGLRLRDATEFEKRVERQRQRLGRKYASALEALAEAAEEREDVAEAAAWWRERANEDPYDSRVVLRLMGALAEAGNRGAALRIGRIHQRLVQEELGTSPDPAVEELMDRLQASPATDEDRDGREPDGAAPEAETAATGRASGPSPPEPEPDAGAAVQRESLWGRRRALAGGVAAVLILAAGFLLVRGIGGDGGGGTGGTDARPSVAVLPFQALGEDSPDDFTEGIHAGLITRLASVSGITVVSGTSVRQYGDSEELLPEIARKLGVGWILEGEVQRIGDQVLVNAQLIDAGTDRHVWAEEYRRELSAENLFDIQEEVARRIVQALDVELSPEDERQVASVPTRSTAAYELYLQAEKIEESRRGEHAAATPTRIELYRRALELDPAFAQAWAGLADAYVHRAWARGYSRTWADSGRVAARRALEHDPDLADAHAQLGDAVWVLEGATAATDHYWKALDLQPGNWYAANNLSVLLNRTGELAEKARLLDRRMTAVPGPGGPVAALIGLNLLLGRDGVAERWRGYAREHDLSFPETEFDMALFLLGDTERASEQLVQIPEPADGRIRTRRRAALALYQGDWDEALRWYRELYPGQRGASHSIFNGLLEDRLAFAWTLDRLGQQQDAREIASAVAEEARAQVNEPSGEFTPAHQLAVASLILGDSAAALDWLEEGVERGYRAKGTLETVPTLAPLRDQARFRELLARVDSLVAGERRRVEEGGWAEPRE